MLSLSELAKIRKKKLIGKTKTYDEILKKCHNQIRHMAHRDQVFCYYLVPLYVMGLPLYDINACIVYLLKNLKKKGFEVQMTNSQTIYISWKHIHGNREAIPRQPTPINNNWSQENSRYVQQRQHTYPQNTNQTRRQVQRFLERSNSLL